MKSDELIKSSVEELVHTSSESDGISECEDKFFKLPPSSNHISWVIHPIREIQSWMGWKNSPLMCLLFCHSIPHFHKDFNFIPSHNDLGSDLDVSSPSGDRNKIYDPGICIEVESTRFLATFSPVIDTLLPFSSENEDKVFNHGVLASKEKSQAFFHHTWGFKSFQAFFFIIAQVDFGRTFLSWTVSIAPDFEVSRACGFVLRSLELHIPVTD
ncbi:hypothetical protein Tco_0510800 [Tanacetum coccineum]